MSFQVIKPKRSVGTGRPPLHGVSVGLDKAGCFNVGIGSDVAERIGIIAGDRVNFLWGTDAHLGLLRIERANDGHAAVFRQKGLTLRLTTSRRPDWMRKGSVSATEAVIVEQSGKSVTVRIPAAFYNAISEAA